MKLQLYVQQVNGALEETSQSVLSSLPRILRDTQLLQQETLALREKMVAVKQEIAKVNRYTRFIQSDDITLVIGKKRVKIGREGHSFFYGDAREDRQNKNRATDC